MMKEKQCCDRCTCNGLVSLSSVGTTSLSMGRRGNGRIGAFVVRTFWRAWYKCPSIVETEAG
jgi:hypothetical protein